MRARFLFVGGAVGVRLRLTYGCFMKAVGRLVVSAANPNKTPASNVLPMPRLWRGGEAVGGERIGVAEAGGQCAGQDGGCRAVGELE